MKIYKITTSLLLIVLVVFASCTDKFNEYNTIQSGATEEETERDGYRLRSYMLTMQSWVIPTDINTTQFIECLLGGSYGGYLADSNAGFNNRNFSTYKPEEHWIQVGFNEIIPKIITNNSSVKSVTADPVFRSVADVIKVMAISRITDIYGPIPYSKVGENGQLTAPYDSQEEVYKTMFKELTSAIKELTARRTQDFTPKADRVYQGNIEKWIKLANSLKLRLAIRVSIANPELAKKMAEEATSNEVGLIENNADNASMIVTKTNPFRVVMWDYNEGDSRISADITSYMNGYKDPRMEKYFTKSTFKSEKITDGYIGIRSGIMIPDVPQIKLFSNMNVEPGSKLQWMNAAEVAFLKAEGALRGWNMGASTEDLYNKGIKLSFEQWGASGAEKFSGDSVSKPIVYKDPLEKYSYMGTTSDITIKWDKKAGFNKMLERIITQKWIANFPNGIEAWSEYRRTGYPALMKVDKNLNAGIVSTERMARRLPYPQEEYSENAANVAIAVSQYLKGPDNMGTDVWWAKKTNN